MTENSEGEVANETMSDRPEGTDRCLRCKYENTCILPNVEFWRGRLINGTPDIRCKCGNCGRTGSGAETREAAVELWNKEMRAKAEQEEVRAEAMRAGGALGASAKTLTRIEQEGEAFGRGLLRAYYWLKRKR